MGPTKHEGSPRPVTEGGLVAYYGLEDWWSTTFTEAQRQRIRSRYKPVGIGTSGAGGLDCGPMFRIEGSYASAATLVANLIGWLTVAPDDANIRRKLRTKLGELVRLKGLDPIAKHFALARLGKEFYRDRGSDPSAVDAAIEAFREQVRLAPEVEGGLWDRRLGCLPRHEGYEALANILSLRGEVEEAIRLCEEAQDRGWQGDGEARIGRYKKAAARAGDR